jgi:hypothetical protein
MHFGPLLYEMKPSHLTKEFQAALHNVHRDPIRYATPFHYRAPLGLPFPPYSKGTISSSAVPLDVSDGQCRLIKTLVFAFVLHGGAIVVGAGSSCCTCTQHVMCVLNLGANVFSSLCILTGS